MPLFPPKSATPSVQLYPHPPHQLFLSCPSQLVLSPKSTPQVQLNILFFYPPESGNLTKSLPPPPPSLHFYYNPFIPLMHKPNTPFLSPNLPCNCVTHQSRPPTQTPLNTNIYCVHLIYLFFSGSTANILENRPPPLHFCLKIHPFFPPNLPPTVRLACPSSLIPSLNLFSPNKHSFHLNYTGFTPH